MEMKSNEEIKTLKEKDLKNKIGILIGTRPSLIKMGTLIKELEKRNLEYFVLHAGQHYSYTLNETFFEELGIKEPDHIIESTKNCSLHGEQTAEMLKGIEKVLLTEKPKIFLVCGDANFNLAGALAARKLHINLGHVEAGLRSGNWEMPEEHNRVMIDHISDFLFCPTENAKNNAIKDNVKGDIFVTGNTVVDAVLQNSKIASEKSNILSKLEILPNEYFLFTAHREENVDHENNLIKIKNILESIADKYEDMDIIYPIHPRTTKRLKEYNLKEEFENIPNLKMMKPVGYFDFLKLMKNSKIVLTDSGGIQEETCTLKVPCITLREDTERPETLEVGSNILTGLSEEKMMEAIKKMSKIKRDWSNPFGDGKTSERIIDICKNHL